MFIGAVGSWYWQGQVFSQDMDVLPQLSDDKELPLATRESPETDDDSYLGNKQLCRLVPKGCAHNTKRLARLGALLSGCRLLDDSRRVFRRRGDGCRRGHAKRKKSHWQGK